MAFSAYFLIRAASGEAPAFDRETLDRLGILGAFVVYCCSGPVLVVREFDRLNQRGDTVPLRNTLFAAFLMMAWAGSLGVVTLEMSRLVLS